jgi:hypothetical protein
VKIDPDKFARSFPSLQPGDRYAISDISITNSLSIGPDLPSDLMPPPGQPPSSKRGRPYPTIAGLEAILSP